MARWKHYRYTNSSSPLSNGRSRLACLLVFWQFWLFNGIQLNPHYLRYDEFKPSPHHRAPSHRWRPRGLAQRSPLTTPLPGEQPKCFHAWRFPPTLRDQIPSADGIGSVSAGPTSASHREAPLAVAAGLDAQHLETIHGIVEGDALDRARQHLGGLRAGLGRIAGRRGCQGGSGLWAHLCRFSLAGGAGCATRRPNSLLPIGQRGPVWPRLITPLR